MHPYLTLGHGLTASFRGATTSQQISLEIRSVEHVDNSSVEKKQVEDEILNFLVSSYCEKQERRDQLQISICKLQALDPKHILIPLAYGELCRISNDFEQMCDHFAKMDKCNNAPEGMLSLVLSRKALYLLHRFPEERPAAISLIEKAYAYNPSD